MCSVDIIRCNECAVRNCSNWVTKKIGNVWENVPLCDSQNCTSFLKLDEFKMSILLHLLSDFRKTNSLVRILNEYHLTIREKNDYPYFSLVMDRK